MKTILILDDEQAVRESFADYFEDQQWRTIQSESAEQALELISHEKPDAAIIDVRLPGMNGNEFIREACKKNSNMVFVLCTGSPKYNLPKTLLDLPCVSHNLFKKPVCNMNDIEKAILQTIEKFQGKLDQNE